MLDGRFRATVDKGVEPIGHGIKRTGLTADHFTILGLVLSAASCVAIGTGHLRLGGSLRHGGASRSDQLDRDRGRSKPG